MNKEIGMNGLRWVHLLHGVNWVNGMTWVNWANAVKGGNCGELE